MDPSQDQSSAAWNVLTVVMHLLSASILSGCLARRSFFHISPKQLHPAIWSSQIASLNGFHRPTLSESARRPSAETSDTLRKPIGWMHRFWRDISLSGYTFQTTPARFTTFLTLVTSLLFVISSSIVVTGVGLNSNTIASIGQGSSTNEPEPTISCEAVICLCIFFYGLTKIFVYILLIERVYIVSSAGATPPRMSTRTYKAGILGIIVYIGIVILLIFGRITEVKTLTHPTSNAPTSAMVTEVCTIGLRLYGAIPLIIYETVLTIVLTAMFILPILNSEGHGHKRRLWPCPFFRRLVAFTTPSKHHTEPIPNLTPEPSNAHNPIPLVPRPITPSATHTDDDAWFNSSEPQQSSDVPSSWVFELEHQGLQSKELSQLAKRCLFGSLAGLIFSFTNISVLASRSGREEGATCMRWCVADVVINALAIYAVMQGKEDLWWVRDAMNARPDVSLPPGIWGDTGHGTSAAMTATTPMGRLVSGTGDACTRTIEKSRRRSVGFLDAYTMGSGQRSPPSVRLPHVDDHASPLSPPPAKLSPLDSLLSRRITRKAKCVSLQADTRRPSGIKMRSSSSSDSLRRHVAKQKGMENNGWGSDAASSSSAITAQGHLLLATPSPLLLDTYPQTSLAAIPPTSPEQQNSHSCLHQPSFDHPSSVEPDQIGELPPPRKRRWSNLEALFRRDP